MGSDLIDNNFDRRGFVKTSIAITAGIAVGGLAISSCKKETMEIETTPNEDLMREHGLLDRVLLIYEANIRSAAEKNKIEPQIIHSSANIIRNFIENYHEKLEEEYVFPVLVKAQRETGLVTTLLKQHKLGRELTDAILAQSQNFHDGSSDDLIQNMKSFVYMYHAHAPREDTVIFPAFKELVGSARYQELGDIFEDKEHELFGKEGFEGVLKEVEDLEKKIGIFDLNIYSPSRIAKK